MLCAVVCCLSVCVVCLYLSSAVAVVLVQKCKHLVKLHSEKNVLLVDGVHECEQLAQGRHVACMYECGVF